MVGVGCGRSGALSTGTLPDNAGDNERPRARAGAAPPPGTAPGSAPAFGLPEGGLMRLGAGGAGNSVCTLFRRDGTRFAESVRDGLGRTVRMEYFDEDGRTAKIIHML